MKEELPFKPKKVDRRKGRDELNLIEFPIYYPAKYAPKELRVLVFNDPENNRGLTINAGGNYGLPAVFDAKVLAALITLARYQHNFTQNEVRFSYYQLMKLLGKQGIGGKDYQGIHRSLKRWGATTYEYRYTWWDHKRKTLIPMVRISSLVSMALVDPTRESESPLEEEFCTCKFADILFNSLRSGYVKVANLEEWFQIQSFLAFRMYQFLGKRFYRKRSLEFDLFDFAFERIGLSRNYIAATHVKRRLNKAIQELEILGFLKALSQEQRYTKVRKGKWLIHFERGDRQTNDATTKLIAEAKAPRPKLSVNSKLMGALTERGVSERVARSILTNKSIADDRVREKIDLFDWYKEEKLDEITSPGGWLAKAIEHDYQPPQNFKPRAERKAEAAALEARKMAKAAAFQARRQEQQEREQEQLRIKAYLDTLSAEQRQALEEEAIAHAPAKERNKYERNKGNPAGKLLLGNLVEAQVLRRLDENPA